MIEAEMGLETIYRLVFLFLLVSAVSISTYFRKKASKTGGKISGSDRKSRSFLAFRIAATFLMLGFFVLYLVNSKWIEWSYVHVPEFLRWAGAVLGLLCTVLFFWMFRSIGINVSETEFTRDGHALVTGGPYNYVRHPLYSAAMVWYPALFLLTANWLFLLLAFTLIIFLIKRIPREESNLIKEFGSEYREYMKKTGMLVPRLKVWSR